MKFPTGLTVLAIVATPGLTFAEAGSVPAPTLQVGDSWVYDQTHEAGQTGFAEQRVDLAIDRVSSDTMLVGIKRDGAPTAFQDHISGLDWSQRRMVDGKETVTGRPFSFPLKVGDTWTADYAEPTPHGLQTYAHFQTTYKVVGWEDVTVPAGTFHALKIEANGTADGRINIPASAASAAVATPGGATTMAHTQRAQSGVLRMITYGEFYYVPEVKYYVKSVEEQYNGENVRTRRDTWALVSFKTGK